MIRATGVAFLLALLAAAASAAPTTDLQVNGPADTRVDVVFLGDGYTATELAAYASDVDAMVTTFFAEQPFAEYRNYFNVRRIDVVSAQSGADHPDRGEYVDTALGASYSCAQIARLLCVDYGAVQNLLNASVEIDARDIVIVIVNDLEYGGSGGAFSVTSKLESARDVVVHEIGHSFGLLGDEYEYSPPACNVSFEPPEPNLTLATDRARIKWNVGGGPPHGWIDPATPVPYQPGGPADAVSLYDGGKYCAPGAGMYRPTLDSKMRSLGQPFGPVNEEALIRRIYEMAYPVESQQPADEVQIVQFGSSQIYSITKPRPASHALDTYWFLDSSNVKTGGDSLTLSSADLTPGPHQVYVWVNDDTPRVRNDPSSLLWGYAIWEVFVATDDDVDGDGVADVHDTFPNDPFESADFDGDLVGDNADADDDNDSVSDEADAFPHDGTEWLDTDGDGVGNNADADDDNDGVTDQADDYPLGRFDDVRPGYWSFRFIEALARAGITAGCGNGNFCPTLSVTRAQMAVFLMRGMYGASFAPAAATGLVFNDVPGSAFAASFIERMHADRITTGCGNNNYCPAATVTRDQMAVFLLRAKHGSGYSPPAATGLFVDVPLAHWAARWIEQLAREGITAGCGNGKYCPNVTVTRDQMAVFLVRTFGLP